MDQATETLIREAIKFALWGAGEGFVPGGDDAWKAPDEFLFEFCIAKNLDDWDALPDQIVAALTTQ